MKKFHKISRKFRKKSFVYIAFILMKNFADFRVYISCILNFENEFIMD